MQKATYFTIPIAIAVICYVISTAEGSVSRETLLLKEIREVAKMYGNEYTKERDRLVEKINASKINLSSITHSKEEWEVKMMSEIIIMRVAKKDLVTEIENSEMLVSNDRGGATRIYNQGKDLAARCQKVPMIIVEALWKKNMLTVKFDSVEGKAYFCTALGLLEYRNARPILEQCLNDENYEVRATAASALGRIGDPESIPALFSLIESSESEKWTDYKIAAEVATKQIPKCANNKSIEYLKQRSKETKSEKTRLIAEQLIREIGKMNKSNGDKVKMEKKNLSKTSLIIIFVVAIIGATILFRKIYRKHAEYPNK